MTLAVTRIGPADPAPGAPRDAVLAALDPCDPRLGGGDLLAALHPMRAEFSALPARAIAFGHDRAMPLARTPVLALGAVLDAGADIHLALARARPIGHAAAPEDAAA